MSEPTWPQRPPVRDAASLIFNLPGYTVGDAVDLPLGGRRVIVRAVAQDEGCPDCGVISTRVHAWSSQRVKDIPAGGEMLEVVVRKPGTSAPSRPVGVARSSRSPTSSRSEPGV